MTEFIETPQEQPDSILATLVGEGKQYKTIEDLAKGKLNADQTIKDREDEAKRLREALERQLETEELIRRASEQSNARQTPEANQPAPAREPAIKPEDLVRQVRDSLTAEERQNKLNDNKMIVRDRLLKEFGDDEKVNEFVRQKASELGVGVEWLIDAASHSPNAFYKTIGLAESPTSTPKPSSSDVNPRALGERTDKLDPNSKAYFDEIRRTNVSHWASPKVQTALSKAARAALEKGIPWE